LIAREVEAKTVLIKSKLTDYCVNPYSGCEHACAYCYVPQMPWNKNRFKQWGESVEVKVNAAEVLARELEKAKRGTVMVSSATDAWQPLEQKYGIARKCLEALAEKDFPLTVLTKSALVTRDADVLKRFSNATVGLTITTDREEIAAVVEPRASPVRERLEALKKLREQGLRTYAFIGPLIPLDVKQLAEQLHGIDFAFIDCLRYATPALKALLEENGWSECLSCAWAEEKKNELAGLLREKGVDVKPLF